MAWTGRWRLVLGASLVCAGCAALPQPEPWMQSLVVHSAMTAGQVARIRGLELRKSVPVKALDKTELSAAFRKLFQEEWTDHDRDTERAYKLFGLLPADMDLENYLIDFYTQQVAGYYDPRTDRFFVVEPSRDDRSARVLRSYVVSHELVHALQDQHFDLEKISQGVEGKNDQELAVTALIEGDATLAGFDHLLWQQAGLPTTLAAPIGRVLVAALARFGPRNAVAGNRPEARALREAPDIVRSELLFSYIQGTRFVSAIRSEFGWAGINRLYTDPPESTEQILHPERYIDRRDRPVRIRLAAGPEGWNARFESTLGMLGLQVLLRQHRGRAAVRAAEGWDGDRYVVWETPAGPALGMLTVWDRSHPAWRFERTYRRALSRKLGPQAEYTVLRRGKIVVAIEGGPAGGSRDAAQRLLQSEILLRTDDRNPDGWFRRLLLWPVSARRFDHVFQLEALGGHLFHLRTHPQAHLFSLAEGLVARSESTPDRQDFSLGSGLVWSSRERRLGYHAAGIALLGDFHTRGPDLPPRLALALARLPFVGAIFSLHREYNTGQFDLLSGLLVRVRWGAHISRGRHLQLFLLPIPGI